MNRSTAKWIMSTIQCRHCYARVTARRLWDDCLKNGGHITGSSTVAEDIGIKGTALTVAPSHYISVSCN